MNVGKRIMKTILKWLIARLWKNIGKVTDSVYRSGQMGFIRLPITIWLLRIDFIVGLNMDDSSHKEKFERWYTEKKGIPTLYYNWGASGNSYPEQLERVIATLEMVKGSEMRCLAH